MQAKMQQLRARPAVSGHGAVLTARTPKCVPITQQLRSRQHLVAAAIPDDDSTKQQEQPECAEDINSRILSGEFTDSGSTKEKLTRPIRKALAQDPLGIGRSQLYCKLSSCVLLCWHVAAVAAAAAVWPMLLQQLHHGQSYTADSFSKHRIDGMKGI